MATAPILPFPMQRAAQFNWITSDFEPQEPEQLLLPLEADWETVLPDDDRVTLLATESGSQLLVSGFGL